MSDCRQIARSVADLIVGWLGIVKGVVVPSAFALRKAMCSRSRTISNPRACSAQHAILRCVDRELGHGYTLASATNASITGSSTLRDSAPNVST